MKLSMTLLARYLKQYYRITEEIKEDPLSISGVRFLADDRKEILPDYVYVGEMTAFSSDPKYKESILLALTHRELIPEVRLEKEKKEEPLKVDYNKKEAESVVNYEKASEKQP